MIRAEHEESVQVSGDANVQPAKDFESFVGDCKHSKQILRNISECGFQRPTTVQQHAMPGVRDAQDMYVIAPTGSGKTLAFLLPGTALCWVADEPVQQSRHSNAVVPALQGCSCHCKRGQHQRDPGPAF